MRGWIFDLNSEYQPPTYHEAPCYEDYEVFMLRVYDAFREITTLRIILRISKKNKTRVLLLLEDENVIAVGGRETIASALEKYFEHLLKSVNLDMLPSLQKFLSPFLSP